MALFDVLLPVGHARRHVGRRGSRAVRRSSGTDANVRCDQVADLRVLDVPGHRDEQLRRHVHPRRNSREDRPASNDDTVAGVPRIGRPSGCFGQNCCAKTSWTRSSGASSTILISSRITPCSRTMSAGRNAGPQHHVAQQIGRERQMLVEHLDVVAGVFLGRERVELPANRVDLLGDLLRGPIRRALEEHVLDEMRDAALGVALVPRPAHQPHADRHRPHVRHRLGHEPQAGRQRFGYDHLATLRAGRHRAQTAKLFTCLGLRENLKFRMIP